jgi:hypothetical protein
MGNHIPHTECRVRVQGDWRDLKHLITKTGGMECLLNREKEKDNCYCERYIA